ncbi:MAG: hypothetical protein ACLS7Z_03440 [Christensenellales bacterium]
MIFNSYAFLAFFPIVTLAYYRMPSGRAGWLLAASYSTCAGMRSMRC